MKHLKAKHQKFVVCYPVEEPFLIVELDYPIGYDVQILQALKEHVPGEESWVLSSRILLK